MGLRLAEPRIQRRRRFVGPVPAKLYTLNQETEIYCRPLDVSQSGFSVYTDEMSGLDDDLILVLGEHVVELTKVYSIASPGLKNGYRHGFKVKDHSIDLEQICVKLGCL